MQISSFQNISSMKRVKTKTIPERHLRVDRAVCLVFSAWRSVGDPLAFDVHGLNTSVAWRTCCSFEARYLSSVAPSEHDTHPLLLGRSTILILCCSVGARLSSSVARSEHVTHPSFFTVSTSHKTRTYHPYSSFLYINKHPSIPMLCCVFCML